MTVANENNRSGPYNGNGVTTVFDYDFKIYDQTHIDVIKTDAAGAETTLTLTTDYTVSGVGADVGGNVTLLVALPAGQTLTMVRKVPFTQGTDLENQGAYYADTVERALDLATMRDQELFEQLERVVKVGFGEEPQKFPPPANDMVLGWGDDGILKNVSPAEFINDAGFATAAQGAKADTALQPAIIESTLDLRYLRIISNPEKNLLQRGFVADAEDRHDENTAILNEAADELTGAFGGLYLPLGQYFVNEDVAPIVDTTAYFRGDGKAASRLLFRPENGDYGTPVEAGIRFNLSSLGYTVGVRDMSVYIKGLSSAAAIRIERPDDQNSGGFAGPIIENVETKGLSLSYGFANGLYLNNCWQARVVNFDDTGKYLGLTAYDYAPMIGSSIVLDGNSTAVVMEQIHATHRDSLLFTIEGSFSEGIKLLHSEAVNVNRGVVAHSALGAVEGSSPPGMTIFDCHFACNETAIEGYLRPQVIISQCLIYNRLGGFAIAPSTPPADVAALQAAASAFIALYLNNTNQSKALDNILIGFGRGTFLFGDTSIRTEIRGNTIEDAETGFNGNNNSAMHDTGNYLNSTPTERTGWTGSTSGANVIW